MNIYLKSYLDKLAEIKTGPTEQEIAWLQNFDRMGIKSLRDSGSNLSKPHTFEHRFVTSERAKADAVVNDELTRGYKASKISTANDGSGEPYFYFDLTKAMVPEEKKVFSDSLRMMTLEKKHRILYDGWGCRVEK